jgi:AsmA protein
VLAILGGLVLLALLTVLTVTVFVDPNRYRGQIESRVTRLTGQPFKITGDLHISWWPWLALTTGPSQFGQAAGSDAQPILQWQAARVGARLVPLLQGQLLIDTIRLEGANVYLARHADGSTNWDPVLATFHNKPPQPERPEPPQPGEPTTPGPEVTGFQLRKGALTYVDERPGSGRKVLVSNWDLDIGEWRPGSTFPVETQLVLAVGQSVRADNVKISTRLHLSDDANDIDLFALDFSGQIFGGKTLPKAGLPLEFEISRMAVRVSPLDVAITEMSGRTEGLQFTTSIQAGETGPDKTLYVKGPLDVRVPSARDALKVFGVKASLPVDKKTFGAAQLKGMLEWQEAGAINATEVDVKLDETHLTGATSRAADGRWTFAFHGDKIALARYVPLEEKSKQPFELPVRALKALQAKGELTFEQATMGETQLHGVRMRFELADGKVRTASK